MKREDMIEGLDRPQIQVCETRLALSASLVGDLLMEALSLQGDIEAESVEDSASSSPDLIEQAAQLRAEQGLDGSGQSVVVIDSGVAWDHIALGGGFGPGNRVVGGWDFAENDALPYDDGPSGYHGTHVAGLMVGEGEGLGVAPGADLISLRVFDDDGAGELEWIESALQWVHDNRNEFESPITTINLSVGAALNAENLSLASEMLSDELQQLRDDQIMVFAAAGNAFDADGQQGVLFPASDSSVIAVASIDDNGQLSDFSQRANGVLAARGESIESTIPEHVYGWDGSYDDVTSLDGSSMATPQVAAASMLVRQALVNEGIEPTPELIMQRLMSSSQIDTDTGHTYHTVDLLAAVNSDSGEGEQTTIDRFIGTPGGDTVQLDLRSGVVLNVDGQSFQLQQSSSDQPMLIDVGNGADSIEIIGSDSAERLIARPGQDSSSWLTTNDFELELRGFENIEFAGGGGTDRATLYDALTDDTLQSNAGNAELTGVGFRFDVTSVPRIYVHATGGGNDTAFLHDSAGDDMLAVRPQSTSLRGEDTFQLAYGFERVYAYASAGGNDSAEIYDSERDDMLSVSSSRSMISSEGYYVSARGFSSVVAHASSGGDDLAKLYSDQSESQWHATSDMVQLTENSDVRVARGFERVQAFEKFETIDLALHRIDLDPFDDDEDPHDRALLEDEALRSVFESLGNDE